MILVIVVLMVCPVMFQIQFANLVHICCARGHPIRAWDMSSKLAHCCSHRSFFPELRMFVVVPDQYLCPVLSIAVGRSFALLLKCLDRFLLFLPALFLVP